MHFPAVRMKTMNTIRVTATLALAAAVTLAAAPARASGLELRLGGYVPRADSVLFRDSQELYGVTRSDFQSFAGGVEYTKTVGPMLEIGLSLDVSGRDIPSSYRDFTRPSGREIQQTLRLVTAPLSATLRLVPTGRSRAVAPYVGVGFSLISWQYEEWGDFIDFDDRGLPVVADSFKSTGSAPGLVLNAGVRVRINDDLQAVADFRRFQGREERMGGDFAPNELDLTGNMFTVGVRLRF
jgi:opacity protein-like surface antigen